MFTSYEYIWAIWNYASGISIKHIESMLSFNNVGIVIVGRDIQRTYAQ